MEYIFLLVSYLMGSIPVAFWLVKLVFKVDIRTLGSGNAGATNVHRNFGWKFGFLVLILDILKGYFAVQLPVYFGQYFTEGWLSVFAFTAAIGHVYPVFARFKGGKGVASLLGAMLALNPLIASLSILHFLSWMVMFRYVSVASILSGIFFALLYTVQVQQVESYSIIFVWAISCLIVYTHRSNLSRLFKGIEPKFGTAKA